jgi:carbamoyltransferase
MNILGISAFYHDSAACLVQDGEIVAAAQEERFSRKKHDPAFPQRAAQYCVAQAGIGFADLDLVAFYDKPLLKFDRLLETYVAYSPRGFKLFRMGLPLWLRQKLQLPRELDRGLGVHRDRVAAPDQVLDEGATDVARAAADHDALHSFRCRTAGSAGQLRQAQSRPPAR